ncbi:MAG: helix-turn-helix domain-containing protein [Methylococcaceae bacterium]|nr:helix-turn-helix domain-containing protein [Methylococcaceae bacterium]
MDFLEIGRQITSLRQQQKLSQQRVAEHVGISRSTLNALETGRAGDVGLRKVLKILDYLGYEMSVKEKSSFPTFEELSRE